MTGLKVVLIDVISPHQHTAVALKELRELKLLVKSYGGIDVIRIIQHKTAPDKATFIGSGKLEELKHFIQRTKVSRIIINSIVEPTQLFNLTKVLWTVNPNVQVWDRIDLILNIFEKHARSAEAKLQIEIARMKHMRLRIYGLGGTLFSRQAGGIGTRGIGETNIERMRRHFKRQIKRKKDELAKLIKQRKRQLERRRENGIKTISILGYTNAGKTSLFNLLTGKNKHVKDALFVTLESSTGILNSKSDLPLKPSDSERKREERNHKSETNTINWGNSKLKKIILISDTIGFIHNLPPSLIDSFRSTLMESTNADLILHVVDIADEKLEQKIKIVEEIIRELGISAKKQLLLFNKIDKLASNDYKLIISLKNQYDSYSPQFISATTSQGITQLKQELFEMI